MEKDDKGSTLIRIGVSGWKFLLVPAYPGCPGSKAVKRSLLLLLSGTTWLCHYQKKHSPTHTNSDHHTATIHNILLAWQSSSTTSLQVLFGLPLGLELSTSYSIQFFIQSLPSFRNTCPYHCDLFCCSTATMSSISNLSLLAHYLEICLYLNDTHPSFSNKH